MSDLSDTREKMHAELDRHIEFENSSKGKVKSILIYRLESKRKVWHGAIQRETADR